MLKILQISFVLHAPSKPCILPQSGFVTFRGSHEFFLYLAAKHFVKLPLPSRFRWLRFLPDTQRYFIVFVKTALHGSFKQVCWCLTSLSLMQEIAFHNFGNVGPECERCFFSNSGVSGNLIAVCVEGEVGQSY